MQSSGDIVISGAGWVTPFADGTIEQVLSAGRKLNITDTANGESRRVPDDLVDRHADVSAQVKKERDLLVTAVALDIALARAGLRLDGIAPERIGIVLGCALAGQDGMIQFADEVRKQTPRFVSPIHFPQTVGNYTAGGIGRAYHIRGPNITLSCGTASGLEAVATAADHLCSDDLDVVIAGGIEVRTNSLFDGSTGDSSPPSESACIFVLESAGAADRRKAAPLARIGQCRRVNASNAAHAIGKDSILSCAGTRLAGAAYAEHWTGPAQGASGAAAIATAIGAARGLDVPVITDESVAIRSIRTASDGSTQCVAIADADGAYQSVIEFTVTSGK